LRTAVGLPALSARIESAGIGHIPVYVTYAHTQREGEGKRDTGERYKQI